MHTRAMSVAADRQRILACLSDPSRFSLVTTLAAGPRCVTDLAIRVGLSQSCTTRHLQALLRAGIVTGRRDGKRVMYALEPAAGDVRAILEWVCAIELDGADTPQAAPRRTRRRAAPAPAGTVNGEAALEPELPAIHAAVEHESGWVGADAAADPEADPADLEAVDDGIIDRTDDGEGTAPRPFRRDMDDFLL